MARTVNGNLVLVPESVQKGDIIATRCQRWDGVRFVFRPVGPKYCRRDIDDRITQRSRRALSQVNSEKLALADCRRLETLPWQIMHGMFTGTYFKDFAYDLHARPDKHKWDDLDQSRLRNFGTVVVH